MNKLDEAHIADSVAQESAYEIPSAFRRAFEPTLLERAASLVLLTLRSLRGRLRRRVERAWLPRESDPVTELKHVYLGEYGLLPAEFTGSVSRRRCCPDF